MLDALSGSLGKRARSEEALANYDLCLEMNLLGRSIPTALSKPQRIG